MPRGRKRDSHRQTQPRASRENLKRRLRFETLEDRRMLSGDYTLQLLHASDFEAGIPALVDAKNFSSVLEGLKAEYPGQTLVVSSGDNYIPGPFYSAGGDPTMRSPELQIPDLGRADISILNALGIQASALGNHDFDESTSRIRSLIAPQTSGSSSYPGASFPYLSANVDFLSGDPLYSLIAADGQEAAGIAGKVAHSAVVTMPGGEKIGLVGATTPSLKTITPTAGDKVAVSPSDPTDLNALAQIVQQSVDGLRGQGIDKIILLTHLQQLSNEEALADLVRGVDVIVAGGSHQVLADDGVRLRDQDVAVGPYPILKTSPLTGEPIAVVNTGPNYRYVGRLVVTFDANGVISNIDTGESRPYATDAQGVIDTGSYAPAAAIVALTDRLHTVLTTKDSVLFGRTDVFLNGRDSRTQETNLGDLTTEADLAAARATDSTVVAAMGFGGAIRDNIGATDPDGNRIPPVADPDAGKEAGEVSQLDIENSLRYNNGLTLVTVTAAQLREVIEHGVELSGPGRYPGAFPQISGLAYSVDVTQPAGQRVQSLAVVGSDNQVADVLVAEAQTVGDPDRTFRIAVLSYVTQEVYDHGQPTGLGGDGYKFPTYERQNPTRFQRVDLMQVPSGDITTPGSEQYSLGQYLADSFSTTAYAVADQTANYSQRIQRLDVRGDTVLRGIPTAGLYAPDATFYLRDSNTSGSADSTIRFGWSDPRLTALSGDWRGSGVHTIGFYDSTASVFYLQGAAPDGSDLAVSFGAPGAGWIPLVGDWDHDGVDTVGLYDPSASRFYLTNSPSGGMAQLVFDYGAPHAGWQPVTGDWDGDSVDTVGLYDPSASRFFLTNSNAGGFASTTCNYGVAGAGWMPVAGDWDRDGMVTVGLYDSGASTFYLTNCFSSGVADQVFAFGAAGAGWKPITGQWQPLAGQSLRADGPVGGSALVGQALDASALPAIVAEAAARWAAAGAPAAALAAMNRVRFTVADLPGAELGRTTGSTIALDRDAAGHGWFVDPTPGQDEEYSAAGSGSTQLRALDSRAVDQIDLLTVVEHELGHATGLEDLAGSSSSLMSGTLPAGLRRLPGVGPID